MIISVITVISVTSMRSALIGREQAVNSQVHHILEAENATTITHFTSLNKSSTSNNSIHAKATEHADEEFVFCTHSNRASNYDLSTSSVIRLISNNVNNSKIGTNGFCNAGNTAHYRSDRKATLTQVAIRKIGMSASDFTGGKVTSGNVYRITATTLMPSFGSATNTSINTCLNSRMNNRTGTTANARPVVECLSDLGVPARASTAMYVR